MPRAQRLGGSHTQRPGTIVLPEAPLPAEQRVPLFAAEAARGRLLRSFVADTVRAGRRIVITAADPQDLRICESRLRRAGLQAVTRVGSWREACEAPGGTALSLRADLETGFVAPADGVTVISAADLLGSRARHDAPFGAAAAIPLSDAEPMQAGDAALHLGRGLGVLAGLETVEAPDSGPTEMIRMRFADETDVLLPVHDLASVWRHGGDPETLTLDSADGDRRRIDVAAREDVMKRCDLMVEVVRRRFLGGFGLAAAGAVAATTVPTEASAAPSPALVAYPPNRLANVSPLKTDEPLAVAYPDKDAPGDIHAEGVDELLYGRLDNVL